jgi:hypothetical protein
VVSRYRFRASVVLAASSFLSVEGVSTRMPKRKRRSRRQASIEGGSPYSKGQVNRLIDDAVHPLKKTHWVFILVDEALHMINEGDIQQSAYKFVQYSLPELLQKLLKKKNP